MKKALLYTLGAAAIAAGTGVALWANAPATGYDINQNDVQGCNIYHFEGEHKGWKTLDAENCEVTFPETYLTGVDVIVTARIVDQVITYNVTQETATQEGVGTEAVGVEHTDEFIAFTHESEDGNIEFRYVF